MAASVVAQGAWQPRTAQGAWWPGAAGGTTYQVACNETIGVTDSAGLDALLILAVTLVRDILDATLERDVVDATLARDILDVKDGH